MKFRNVGQVLLALVVSVGLVVGVTSCSTSYTVGYLYVPGSQYNQISGFNINNQTGKLTPVQKSPFGSNGTNPVRVLVLSGGRFVYVLNQGTITPCQSSADSRYYPTGDISAYSIDPNTGRLALVTNAQVANPDGTQLTYFPLGCFPVEFKLVGGFIFTAQTGSTSLNDVQTVFSYAQSASNGQLTLTQNAPLQTGATKMTSINSDPAGRYVYLLDAGPEAGCT